MNLKDSLNLYEMTGDLLPESRMKSVLAGEEGDIKECGCACYYSNTGGSIIDVNGAYNFKYGLWSPHPIYWYRNEDMREPSVFIY